MIYYHGTNKKLTYLKRGTCVTKSFKDACKFGYRKSVLFKNRFVYIYAVDVQEPLPKDPIRDRAFVLIKDEKAVLYKIFDTYSTPYKLKNFCVPGTRQIIKVSGWCRGFKPY